MLCVAQNVRQTADWSHKGSNDASLPRTAFNSVRLDKDSFNIAEISYQTDKRHAEERDWSADVRGLYTA